MGSLQAALLRTQNTDGGWGYMGSTSWTEPTALALLAIHPDNPTAFLAGARWLRSAQRNDGGWRPTATVDESTWVTALATLVLNRLGSDESHRRGAHWLFTQTGRESDWVVRLRRSLLGVQPDQKTEGAGWPWFPGAAAWTMPTALTILALQSLTRRSGNSVYKNRIEEGRRFLLSRRCSDGGWNHGSSRALGYEAPSYPETTGVAILALAATRSNELEKSIVCAKQHLKICRSRTALSWLQLGLLANGVSVEELDKLSPVLMPRLDRSDLALAVIAERARGGYNAFLP